MKIALLLSGQPRFYKETFPLIENKILSEYDCDVYAHAWWDESEIETGMFVSPWSRQYKFQLDVDFPERLQELYNPVKHSVEKSLLGVSEQEKLAFIENIKNKYSEKFIDSYVPGAVDGLASAVHKFISVQRAYELINWDENYDFIVYWRYDAAPVNFPNLHDMPEPALYAFTDRWDTFLNRPELPYPYFIDTAFILHAKYKHILRVEDFYFNSFMREGIGLDSNGNWTLERTAESVWAATVAYHDVPLIKLPNNIFSVDLVRKKEDAERLYIL